MHRVHARRAGRLDLQSAFVNTPEPRNIGLPERGKQLVKGQFLFSGHAVTDPNASIWDVTGGKPAVAYELQTADWLDDLAALGTARARVKAQAWVFAWIARFGAGSGPGWTPELTGRRLIQWMSHGAFVLRGIDPSLTETFFQSLARQTVFLSRRWQYAPPGLPRFAALAGLLHAGVMLRGMAPYLPEAMTGLGEACQNDIDEQGGIATRNPEELMQILSLLIWTRDILQTSGHMPPHMLERAINRITPTLRGLRHGDGALPRFHGGGRGTPGRLDAALFASGVRTQPDPGLQMGYLRVLAGRSSLIADAAPPPQGAASQAGHASTLSFELTAGRRPLIVNCGSGLRFGPEWRRAGRATPSHSTLGIAGISSSHLSEALGQPKGYERLRETPRLVRANTIDHDGQRILEISHDGYQRSHGLTHARILRMDADGRQLIGEDMLAALTEADKALFDRKMAATGIPFTIRFHMHPDVDVDIDSEQGLIRMRLKSGEVWTLRAQAEVGMALAPSVYLENGALNPRNTHQVVLSGNAMSYATRVRWSIAKTADTPIAVRDVEEADLLGNDIAPT